MKKAKSFTVGITGIITLVILVSSIIYSVSTGFMIPSPPNLVKSSDREILLAKRQEIENYNTLIDSIYEQKKGMFDDIVNGVLFRLFDALIVASLAFIFPDWASKVYGLYSEIKSRSYEKNTN